MVAAPTPRGASGEREKPQEAAFMSVRMAAAMLLA
jgi:hypothetical protein